MNTKKPVKSELNWFFMCALTPFKGVKRLDFERLVYFRNLEAMPAKPLKPPTESSKSPPLDDLSTI